MIKKSSQSASYRSGSEESAGAASVRKAGITCAVTICVLFAACIALTVYVDPFFHYHRPLPGFPYVVDNQLSQNPGMARNMTYDSFLTGSSMTLNFDTDDFAQQLGLDMVKLSSNGAYPRDLSNVLSFVFDERSLSRKTNPVKAAYIALDVSTFTAPPDETKYPQPTYLYDSLLLNDIAYVLNKDVLLQYVLRPIAEREGTDLSTVYMTEWQTAEYYGEEPVMLGFVPSEEAQVPVSPDTVLPPVQINLAQNILPYVDAHQETEFVFFFPPYSMLYWYNVERENRLEAVLAQYRDISEQLLSRPNVRVFFFPDLEEIVTDLSNYSDYQHYSTQVCQNMVSCFACGAHELTQENLDEVLIGMRDIIERRLPYFDQLVRTYHPDT